MSSTALPKGSSLPPGRFELPVLAPLDSLTAGTNIPPPPDSPIEEAPPPPPSKSEPEIASVVVEGAPVNGHANGVDVTNEYTGRGRTNGPSVPTSPTSQHRPSSIRRFLSRKSLHSNYTNGTNANNSQENLSMGGLRPESPSVYSTASNVPLKRRSGSWFRRFLRGEDEEKEHKRTSVVYEEKAPMGPPPPKLPELSQLRSRVEANDRGSLGADDMFKNIK